MRRRVFAFAAGIVLVSLFVMTMISTVASAAAFSGTWTGTVTMRYYDPSNNLVTINEPAELDLSVSGSSVSGTMTLGGDNSPRKSYDVDGSGSGSRFTISTQFGWDGSTYQPCDMTFNVDGSSMTGGGTYQNVGTTVTLTFTLDKGGSLGGVPSEVIAVGAGAVGALGIITALRPSPKVGLQPHTQFQHQQQPQGHYQQHPQAQPQQYSQAPPEQSYVRETQPVESGPMAQGESWGGAGLHEGRPANAPLWGRTDAPLRPDDWYRTRNDNATPECPRPNCNGHHLRAIKKSYEDPGKWHCDRCGTDPWNYGGP